MNNTNGSGAGFLQTWKPSSPAEAASPRLLLGGWSNLESGGADGGGEDYSIYADIAYADGTFLFGQHAAFDIEPGRGWQYAYSTIDLGGKKYTSVVVYGLFRGHSGVAAFSEFYLGVPPVSTAPMEFIEGSATSTPHPGDCNSSVSVAASLAPASWNESIQLGAVFTGHPSHIRCDGSIALSPGAGTDLSAVDDKAVSLRFSFPVDAGGWKVYSDADHFDNVPTSGSTETFPGGKLRQFGKLPNAISQSPLLVTADPQHVTVIAAVPMEDFVWAYRLEYNAATQAVDITFDFALTALSDRFPSMATFSFMIAWAPSGTKEPFRAGLQRYYDLHERIFGHEHRIHDQGAWMPFISDLDAIPAVEDFGIKFQEGGGSANDSKWMNEHGIDILPYIEPGLMHWSLPKGMAATYDNLNKTIQECCLHPEKYATQAVICQQIVSDAMVDASGRWIFEPENQAWNTGAVFYTNLEMDTVGSAGASRAAEQLADVQGSYRRAVEGGYEINGQYIDSSTAGFELLNYDRDAMKHTRHPPVFDVAGRPVVLGAQPLFSFLKAVSELMHSRGMTLMGNGLWSQPMQLPGVFDIAGTETNWQAPTTAAFAPPSQPTLAFNRAMTGSGPFLYLMDTDFSTWTKEKTTAYFDVCLSIGCWPSFFSANAATAVYFKNASLFERDRPVFQQFVPILKAINAAGWQPLRAAVLVAAAGSAQPEPDVVFVERFGGASVGSLFWTIRNLGAAAASGLSLEVDTASLLLKPGAYSVAELTKSVAAWPAGSSVLRVTSGGSASLQLPPLPAGRTLALQIDLNGI